MTFWIGLMTFRTRFQYVTPRHIAEASWNAYLSQKLAPVQICGISKIMQHSPNPSHTISLNLNE